MTFAFTEHLIRARHFLWIMYLTFGNNFQR